MYGMRPDQFDWDEDNVSHIAEHGVTPEQAEEAILDPFRQGLPAYQKDSEFRFAGLGATEVDDVLFFVFVIRAGKVRVISCRPAEPDEERSFRGKS
jgi:uncharacterized DUF497 family protein